MGRLPHYQAGAAYKFAEESNKPNERFFKCLRLTRGLFSSLDFLHSPPKPLQHASIISLPTSSVHFRTESSSWLNKVYGWQRLNPMSFLQLHKLEGGRMLTGRLSTRIRFL